MNFYTLQSFLIANNEPAYRYSQIVSDICSGRPQSYSDIFTIPKDLRQKLEKQVPLISATQDKLLISSDKKSYKALLTLSDGEKIETVLLNPKPSLWSVCISTQVGCGMGCKFCATGKMGLVRDLTVEEITDQILFWKQYIAKKNLKIRISNIVYMGMGEPFANQKNVFQSLLIFTDPKLFNIGSRHISISTCGLTERIKTFADKFPQVNLAISFHAPNQKLREKLMPIAKQYSLPKLIKSLKYYLDKTNRQIFLEYILLSSENDSDKHALELGNLLIKNFENKLHLIHINLIIYNPIDTDSDKSRLVTTPKNQLKKFKRILDNFHISNTIRKSLGQEIKGACGQLKIS